MRPPLVALAVAVASLLTVAPAGSKSYTIKVDSRGFVSRLGPLRPQTHPFPRDARAAFGRPSSQRTGRGTCRPKWAALKLSALFTSFAAISDFCRDARLQSAVLRSKLWRTWKGLRVGMRSSRVRELHVNARFERGKWVLASQTLFGSEPSPTVSALVHDGRVIALSLFVGAAGD
jgi:hypothetical protein